MNSGLMHELWLPLFGLPLAVHTNSQALAYTLDWEQPLGDWAHLRTELIEAVPTLQIDVVVGDTAELVGGTRLYCHGPISLAGDGPRLLLAQADRGYGLAFVPSDSVSDALAALWDLGMLLARGYGRTSIRAAAIERDGQAVLLVGEDIAGLARACVGRGLRPLAEHVVHVSDGIGGPQIWGDRAGGGLLSCAGPAALCLVERGVGRASQLTALPDAPIDGLGVVMSALRATYRLLAGDDLEMAAALIEHAL